MVPKVSTVAHVKKALCDLIGGVATPDHVTLAHVKDGFIDITLVSTQSYNQKSYRMIDLTSNPHA